jgi:WD40 repeat protein
MTQRVFRAAMLITGALAASAARGQSAPRLQASFGVECPGALTAAWIDSTHLLVGGMDFTVRLYEIGNGKSRLADTFVESTGHLALAERAASVLSLAVDPSSLSANPLKGRFIAGGSDFRARIWNLGPRQRPLLEPPPNGAADAKVDLHFAVDRDSHLFASTSKNSVRVWKVPEIREQQQFHDPPKFKRLTDVPNVDEATSILLTCQNHARLLVAAPKAGGNIAIRRLDEGLQQTIVTNDARPTAPCTRLLSFGTTHQQLLTYAEGGQFAQWPFDCVPEWREPADLATPRARSWTLSDDRATLVTTIQGGGIQMWKISPGAMPELRASKSDEGAPRILAVDRAGDVIAYVAVGPQKIALGRLQNGVILPQILDPPMDDFGTASALALSVSGKSIAVSDEQGRIYFAAVPAAGAPTWQFLGSHEASRTMLRFLDDGSTLVSAGGNDRLSIWRCDKQSLVATKSFRSPVVVLASMPTDSTGLKVRLVAATAKCANQNSQLFAANIQLPSAGSVFEVKNLIADARVFAEPDSPPISLSLSAWGENLLASSRGGEQVVWRLDRDHSERVQLVKYDQPVSAAWLLDDTKDHVQTVLTVADTKMLPPWRAMLKAECDRIVPDSGFPIRPLWLDARHIVVTREPEEYKVAHVYDRDQKRWSTLTGNNAAVTAATWIDLSQSQQSKKNSDTTTTPPSQLTGYIITGSADATTAVRVWNPRSGELLATVPLGQGVTCLTQTSSDQNNQSIVAAGLNDGSYAILDFSDLGLPALIDQPPNPSSTKKPVAALAYLPDGVSLAIGESDGSIVAREVASRMIVGKPPSPAILADRHESEDPVSKTDEQYHSGPVYSVAWSKDGQHVATGSADGCIRLWKPTDSKIAGHVTDPPTIKFAKPWILSEKDVATQGVTWEGDPIYTVAFCDGAPLLVGQAAVAACERDSKDWHLAVWSYKTSAAPNVSRCTEYSASFRSLALDPQKKSVAAGTSDGRVFLWDYPKSDGTLTAVGTEHGSPLLMADRSAPVYGLAFHPRQSAQLATLGIRGELEIWAVDHGVWKRLSSQAAPAPPNATFSTLAWSPDGKLLAVTCVPPAVSTKQGSQTLSPCIFLYQTD